MILFLLLFSADEASPPARRPGNNSTVPILTAPPAEKRQKTPEDYGFQLKDLRENLEQIKVSEKQAKEDLDLARVRAAQELEVAQRKAREALDAAQKKAQADLDEAAKDFEQKKSALELAQKKALDDLLIEQRRDRDQSHQLQEQISKKDSRLQALEKKKEHWKNMFAETLSQYSLEKVATELSDADVAVSIDGLDAVKRGLIASGYAEDSEEVVKIADILENLRESFHKPKVIDTLAQVAATGGISDSLREKRRKIEDLVEDHVKKIVEV